VEDLCMAGRLSRVAATETQEAILSWATRQGEWV
jgi:hypothetical protein